MGHPSILVVLRQRRVAHPEARADVLRNKFNGTTVYDGVFLRQILHGLNQQPLSIYVARIGSAFPASLSQCGRNCNRKNLGHMIPTDDPENEVRSVYLQGRKSPRLFIYCSIFNGLALRCDDLGLAGSFQLEDVVRNLFAVHLNAGVGSKAIVASRLKELLLYGDSAIQIDPQEYLAVSITNFL